MWVVLPSGRLDRRTGRFPGVDDLDVHEVPGPGQNVCIEGLSDPFRREEETETYLTVVSPS